MTTDVLLALGGVGMFLLGMLMMTDGLRRLAGRALRRVLARFTRSPLSGAVTGAATTAVVQSSSATTVTAVGFVGAGLLTFSQALGIIFGAAVGTTATGWIVALLGFKLNLGLIGLPLVFAGAMTRLFGRGRLADAGWALAGFSLLFIGIDAMKEGMAAFEGVVTPANLPDDTLAGRLQLILIGVAITLVTQSSSAGVATALAAIGAGAISLPQAAAMVIGMNVGTTVTAAMATVGGATAARRTGLAFVIYNLLTGVMAYFLLVPFTAVAAGLVEGGGRGDEQIALVAFHTTFNVLGVMLVLPVAGAFARLVVWLVPERGAPLLRKLGDWPPADPAAAVDQAVATTEGIADETFAVLADLLAPKTAPGSHGARLRRIEEAIAGTGAYLDQVRTTPDRPNAHLRHAATVDALDHLARLARRCTQTPRLETLGDDARLRRLTRVLRDRVLRISGGEDRAVAEAKADRLRSFLRRQRRLYRERTVADATLRRIDAETTLARLDAVRWLHRVAYHLWRIVLHLRLAADIDEPPPETTSPSDDDLDDADDVDDPGDADDPGDGAASPAGRGP